MSKLIEKKKSLIVEHAGCHDIKVKSIKNQKNHIHGIHVMECNLNNTIERKILIIMLIP